MVIVTPLIDMVLPKCYLHVFPYIIRLNKCSNSRLSGRWKAIHANLNECDATDLSLIKYLGDYNMGPLLLP